MNFSVKILAHEAQSVKDVIQRLSEAYGASIQADQKVISILLLKLSIQLGKKLVAHHKYISVALNEETAYTVKHVRDRGFLSGIDVHNASHNMVKTFFKKQADYNKKNR